VLKRFEVVRVYDVSTLPKYIGFLNCSQFSSTENKRYLFDLSLISREVNMYFKRRYRPFPLRFSNVSPSKKEFVHLWKIRDSGEVLQRFGSPEIRT
jgi:hypothetical protein